MRNFGTYRLWALGVVAAVLTAGAAVRAAGPTSEYYLTGAGQKEIYVVQGSNVVRSWTPSTVNQSAIAVDATVRTIATDYSGEGNSPPTSTGGEYTLAGAYTGVRYVFPLGSGYRFYDATTDGTYNYAWAYDQGAAYRFNSDWTNPTLLFTLGNGTDGLDYRMGITYDPSNKSLWVSGYAGTVKALVEDRAMDGTVLSSFTANHGNITALALDPADGTLWFGQQTSRTTFEQYSRSGTLLGSVSYPTGLGGIILGGEFQYVPEPSALALLTLLTSAILIHRRRRSTSRRFP